MKRTLFFFLFIVLTSCGLFQEKGVVFKIENTSDFTLTYVNIYTSEKLDSLTFDTIPKKGFRAGFLSMKNNKSDGSYTLKYTLNDSITKEISAGYYTNGGISDDYIRFEIQNDTVLFKLGEFPK